MSGGDRPTGTVLDARPQGMLRSAGGTRWPVAAALLAILFAFFFAGSGLAAPRRAVVLDIDGAIGPAVADFIGGELTKLRAADTGLVVLRIDTPGGLSSSMREIIRAILSSPVPVAAYVAPSGARAASAGTYITYACAIAAMAPGTNIGAATPVQLGGGGLLPGGQPQPSGKNSQSGKKTAEPTSAEGRKILNDAVAYIRSLAELNGRNADWAAEAVRGAASLPASEALKLHVIDVIAANLHDLLQKIDGRSVIVAGKPRLLATADLEPVTIEPGWRTRFLSVITDPNIAYLLMLLGSYGLIFELLNPGTVLPGVVGLISLLIALYALNLLPIDYAGAGLVLLGIALMVAEGFIGAFGIIGIGGLVAFVFGSVIMFHAGAPGFTLSLSVVAAAAAVSVAFFLLVLGMLLRSRRRRVVTGGEALIGAEGESVEWDGKAGRVRVEGEIWLAHARHAIPPGTAIRVTGRDGLTLTVERR